jgi:hypothetical protein
MGAKARSGAGVDQKAEKTADEFDHQVAAKMGDMHEVMQLQLRTPTR